MREISITEIENVKIGSAEDMDARTGCTVVICEQGAPTGVDVRGGGPASRETELLSQQATCDRVHAVLLSGGSAFGLDAAGGVMEYLENKGVGLPVGSAIVPLVCQSCIFDLLVGKNLRPDKEMAKRACEAAELNEPKSGRVGAGAGATVGKLLGPDFSMDSGLGIYAVQLGELKVGAVVAVNASGDIIDFESGDIIAGLLNDDKTGFRDSEKTLYELAEMRPGNTTIGVIITNAKFDKSRMTKVAQMAQDGYARSLRPVHTTMDGDTVYAMSVGSVESNVDLVGTLAARVMAAAIRNAVRS
ncbi:MAG: P1 family peptidase [Oscillospiraceae bacterium]|nr:P1 family peptidase [Oscillospiraceae bacterium]